MVLLPSPLVVCAELNRLDEGLLAALEELELPLGSFRKSLTWLLVGFWNERSELGATPPARLLLPDIVERLAWGREAASGRCVEGRCVEGRCAAGRWAAGCCAVCGREIVCGEAEGAVRLIEGVRFCEFEMEGAGVEGRLKLPLGAGRDIPPPPPPPRIPPPPPPPRPRWAQAGSANNPRQNATAIAVKRKVGRISKTRRLNGSKIHLSITDGKPDRTSPSTDQTVKSPTVAAHIVNITLRSISSTVPCPLKLSLFVATRQAGGNRLVGGLFSGAIR